VYNVISNRPNTFDFHQIMYDSTCKFIATQYSKELANWLLGRPLDLTEVKPSELSLEPIRADSVIFLESKDELLHIEFQTDPKDNIPYRMLDYAVRLYRIYPNKEIRQVVIYLTKSNSPLVRQNIYQRGETHHKFEIIRLWEVPYQTLLQSPGLFPFAILSQVENRENLLGEIAQKIEEISDSREQSNVAATTAILAGLVLDEDIIQRLLKEEIMKESVIYQKIKKEGQLEGLQKGRLEGRLEGKQEGKQEGEVNIVLRLLTRRIGGVSAKLSQQIQSLSIEKLENLGEALLDFNSEEDLVRWLEN
jgi:predicted transposase/invertase (TIGR01784 family)